MQRCGLQNVKTYIQSGNVIFQSDRTDQAALSAEISAAIGKSHGFSPAILLLTEDALRAAINANPFPEGEDDPKSLHLFFLEPAPQTPDLAALEALKTETERFALIGQVFYLHAPDGIGRSKLAEKFGRGWGVNITARNWRTVSKLMEMASASAT
ncbi:MAG: DUF1697 domain-containing protein [Caldilineaceae bacterium]